MKSNGWYSILEHQSDHLFYGCIINFVRRLNLRQCLLLISLFLMSSLAQGQVACQSLFPPAGALTWTQEWYARHSKMPDPQKVGAYPGSTAAKVVNPFESEIRSWIRKNTKNGRLKINKPLASQTPEYVVYNWMRWPSNFENIKLGISSNHLGMFVTPAGKERRVGHLGMYAGQDPWGSAHFGEALLEIVLYKDHFPVNKDGKIKFQPITQHQFSTDPSRSAGGSVQHFEAPAMSYVIRDPRIIKELRWPNPEAVLQSWFNAKFEKAIQLSPLVKVGAHWMFAENFSQVERLEIIKTSPERLRSYFNLVESIYWRPIDPLARVRETPPFSTLVYNNVLKAILKSEVDFLSEDPRRLSWVLMLQSYRNLPLRDREEVKSILNFLGQDLWLSKILRLVVGVAERQNADDLKKETIQDYRVMEAALKGYTAYNPKILSMEIKEIEDLK